MSRHNSLFSQGYMTNQPGLSNVLDHCRDQVIGRIQAVSDLSQLTDTFLDALVRDALVEPFHFLFDQMSHGQQRMETFDGSQFPDPFSFDVRRGERHQKPVTRITLPFTGDGALLRYTPNYCTTTFPYGTVQGQAIQFDVVFWGYPDDNKRIKEEIENNRRLLNDYSSHANRMINSFNNGIADNLRVAFESKLKQLTHQNSFFGSLGIKAEGPSLPATSTPPVVRERKPSTRPPAQIIQYIEQQVVQQLTQINHNAGDVNNAIQSD